jgi:hypothetical protein
LRALYAIPCSYSLAGFEEKNLKLDLHSHPDIDGTKGASGYLGNGIVMGDMAMIIGRYKRFQNDYNKNLPNHYLYHKYSQTLYYYTPWKHNTFIKKNNIK